MEIQTTVEHEIDANYLHFVVFCGGSVQWRHNGHRPHYCLLNRFFGRRSKKTSKLRVTGLCAGNSPQTGEFHAQMACNAENVSIWGLHHAICRVYLTHLRLNKMTAIFVDDILKCIFLNENGTILIQISQKIVPRSPTDKKRALVQLMAGRRTGTKPLLEPMITQLTDAHMRH